MPSSNITSDFWQRITPSVPVDKARGYFVLPAFDASAHIDNVWLGASRMATSFNYAAAKNFTIRNPEELPQPLQSETNGWILCIKWTDDSVVPEVVHRYKLLTILTSTQTELDDQTVYVPQYNGELIKKNFTLEIWTTKVHGTSLQLQPFCDVPLTFNTSNLNRKTDLSESSSFKVSDPTECSDLTTPFGDFGDMEFAPCTIAASNE